MSNMGSTAAQEWKRHWPMAVAACIGFSFLSCVSSSVGIFMDPLAHEFGWSRTQLSAGLSIAGLLGIVASPLVGMMLDRWGTRRIALPGIVFTGLALSAFSLANGSFPQWLMLWTIWGIGSLFTQATVWSTAVAGVFNAGRGLALGVTMSGTALAQVIAAPLVNGIIEHYGWRTAYVVLGLGWGGVAFLLSLFFLFDAHNMRSRATVASPEKTEQLSGLSAGAALRDTSLIRVGLATFLTLTVTIAVTVHAFPILVEAGISRDNAAWMFSLSGVAGIVGKIVTGGLIDRFHARWVGGITLASTAIAYPLMMNVAGPALVLVGMLIAGYAAGTKIQLCSYLTARYGGLRAYGTIFGIMTSTIALASVVGPLLAGVMHDHTGRYAEFLMLGVVVSIVSGGLIFSLGRYPDWSGNAEEEPVLSPIATN